MIDRTRWTRALLAAALLLQAVLLFSVEQPGRLTAFSRSPSSDLLLATRSDREVVTTPTDVRRVLQSPDARAALGLACVLLALLLAFGVLPPGADVRAFDRARAPRSRAPPLAAVI